MAHAHLQSQILLHLTCVCDWLLNLREHARIQLGRNIPNHTAPPFFEVNTPNRLVVVNITLGPLQAMGKPDFWGKCRAREAQRAGGACNGQAPGSLDAATHSGGGWGDLEGVSLHQTSLSWGFPLVVGFEAPIQPTNKRKAGSVSLLCYAEGLFWWKGNHGLAAGLSN